MMKVFLTSFLLSNTLLFVSALPGLSLLRRDVDPLLIPYLTEGGQDVCSEDADPSCCPPNRIPFIAVSIEFFFFKIDLKKLT